MFNFAPEFDFMEYNEKQKQIITTAELLFSTKGFDGTSVRDIADEAGVNIAMISYYFGSKEKLMEALFEQRTSNIELRVEALLLDNNLQPLQKMESLIDEYIEKVMNRQRFFKVMICEQVINKNPAIINLIYNLKKRNTEAIARLIKYGQEKGSFRKNIDVLMLMNTLFGVASQMMISVDYYQEYNELQSIPEDQFQDQVKQKLSNHIKFLFKALLSYEA